MGWHKPDPAIVWRAVALYLARAYEGLPGPHDVPATTPSAVRARLDSLRLAPADGFFASPVFERDSATQTRKLYLRLGNRHYPHMKLAISRAPDGQGYLLHADTHDSHCCPAAGSRDFHVFAKLMELNRDVAEQIETAWEAEGLPTFKSYLRDDLQRRRSAIQ